MGSPKWFKKVKRNYKIFTSELSSGEIERLIKSDAPSIFQFYTQDIEKPSDKKNRLIRGIVLLKNLFIAFLKKLTPARRVVYLIALYFFIEGLVSLRPIYLFGGFALLNILLAFELADKITAKDELEIARTIQLGLMPKNAPKHPHYDLAFFNETAREVGGDFYDFLQQDGQSDSMTVAIGDISGKGMAAALHMVQVQAIMHSFNGSFDLKDMLIEMNKKMNSILPSKIFFTITLAELANNGAIRLCRAGHLPVIHYSSKTKKCQDIVPHGIGIGLTENETFAKCLEETTIKPEPGDVMVFYSDGLTETMNKDKEEFGENLLKQLIPPVSDEPAQKIQEHILTGIANFRGLTPPHDDLTLIVMKAV